jgi:hypothetical protein
MVGSLVDHVLMKTTAALSGKLSPPVDDLTTDLIGNIEEARRLTG